MSTAGGRQAPPRIGSDADESNRARRRRLREEREAAIAAAVALGSSPEEAAALVDAEHRERVRAEALERAAQAPGPPAEEDGAPAYGSRLAPVEEGPAGAPPAEAAPPVTLQGPQPSSVPTRQASPARGIERPPFQPSAEGPAAALVARFMEPSRVPGRLGWLVSLVGLLNIAVALIHPVRERVGPLTRAIPGTAYGTVAALAVIAGILLLFLGSSLRRRRRRAWVATVLLLAIALVIHLVRGQWRPAHGLLTTALVTLVLVLLLVYRQQFRAIGDPTTRWGAVRSLVGLFLVSCVVGPLVVAANSRDLSHGWPGLWSALGLTVRGMLGFDITGAFAPSHDRRSDVVGTILFGLGLMTVLVPVVRFFRSPAQPATLTPEDDHRVRSLLDAHPDSLGYFTTRQDKQVVWSATGKSCIGYRVVSGVIIAGGDPLGDPEAWPGAISAFLDLANEHGWTPAVLGCSEVAGTTWVRETGFQVLEMGDEAIVDTERFTLHGRAMRNVRQMVNRIRRQGYETTMLRVRDTPPEVRRQALADADSWRVGGTERGFSMATSRVMDADRDPDDVVVLATREGRVEGMLQFVPWGSDGMSLDLMRRNPTADPGVNELLIVDALLGGPAMGIHRVSLNFAMFRSTFERGERLGAGPVLRMWRRLLIIGNRWFQLESLYKFNDKFQPDWYPRYVIYPRARDIARVGIAMGQAEAFIVFPRFFRLLGVRAP